MRVSTKVEYGVLALFDIAMHSEQDNSVTTMEIALRQGISKKYLEQILPLLRQAKLIKAQRGVSGGYSLARSADDIFLSEILNALDNGILEDMEATAKSGTDKLGFAVNDCLWGEVNKRLREYSDGITLAKLLEDCRKQMPDGGDTYVI